MQKRFLGRELLLDSSDIDTATRAEDLSKLSKANLAQALTPSLDRRVTSGGDTDKLRGAEGARRSGRNVPVSILSLWARLSITIDRCGYGKCRRVEYECEILQPPQVGLDITGGNLQVTEIIIGCALYRWGALLLPFVLRFVLMLQSSRWILQFR